MVTDMWKPTAWRFCSFTGHHSSWTRQ